MKIQVLTGIGIFLSVMALSSCNSEKEGEKTEAKSDSTSALANLKPVDVDSAFASGKMRIGYLNSVGLLIEMKETKAADARLQQFEKQLAAQIENKYKEYQTKMAAFQKEAADMPETTQQMKAQELASLETSIMQLQNASQQELMREKDKLYAPIIEKINSAIKKVAEANNFDYVIDAASNSLVYGKDQYNITVLVAKELGIAIPAN